jgi:hypothetical protein
MLNGIYSPKPRANFLPRGPKTAKVIGLENAEAIVNWLSALPLYMVIKGKCYKMTEIIIETARSGSLVSEVRNYG